MTTGDYTPPFGHDPFKQTGFYDDAYDLDQQAIRHGMEDADLDPEQGGPRPVRPPRVAGRYCETCGAHEDARSHQILYGCYFQPELASAQEAGA